MDFLRAGPPANRSDLELEFKFKDIRSKYLFMPFRIFCCKHFYFLDMSLCERKWTFAAFANMSFFKEILCFLNGHQGLKSEFVTYTYKGVV